MYVKWNSNYLYYRQNDGTSNMVSFGSADTLQFMVHASLDKPGSCPNWLDPHRSVLASFNRLMLYAGAFLAKETANGQDTDVADLMAHLDPDLEVNYTTTGYIRYVFLTSLTLLGKHIW